MYLLFASLQDNRTTISIVYHFTIEKTSIVKLQNLTNMLDPFSAEFAETLLPETYFERAEDFADAWDEYDDFVPNASHTMLVPKDLVDDLPF